MSGVIARGIKTPIIKAGNDLVEIVTESILNDAKTEGYEIKDKDVIAITEGVVAIANNNFVTVDDISNDLKTKLNSEHIGLVYPIFSRNRFSIILKGIARSTKKVTILMPYPSDEVGNPNINESDLNKLIIENDVVMNDNFFYEFKHPYTNVNIINYYKEIVEKENASINFVFSNNAKVITNYTKNIIVCEIHNRNNRYLELEDVSNKIVRLTDILNKPINNSGYNEEYGLLGSNVQTFESLKLFPREDHNLLLKIQEKIKTLTNKHVEVMVFGDGAFKDPTSGIWELADPVVSPFYTKGLIGSPSEVKIKMLVATKYKDLEGEALENALKEEIENKNKTESSKLGTTPRMYTDLIGSLADLVVGSGDKKTPVVLIQNYFK